MTVPSDNVYLAMQFNYSSSAPTGEMAQIGFWGSTGEDIPSGDAAWDAYLADLAGAAAAQWGDSYDDANFASDLRFGTVKAVHYNTNGTTANEQVAVHTPQWAGSGGDALPWTVSQVVGLYSYTPGLFIPQARRRRGRVYLPGLAVGMMASAGFGLFDTTKATANMSSTNDFLTQLHAGTYGDSSGFVPMVFSRMASHLYAVTDLTTDVKPDTQRRRLRQVDVPRLTESYSGD